MSLQERQRLIAMYTAQYNQTNTHITRLFNTLDDIRNNINTLVGNSNTNSNTNMNNMYTNSNMYTNRSDTQPAPRRHVYYDYSNPIERSTYMSDFMGDNNNNNNNNNNNTSTDFLTTFLSTFVPVRPTQEQIDTASRLIRFEDIQTPNSTICAISLEPFTPSDTVRQLNHCAHIFFPDQFNQWFQNNVKCPVCRHDIRSSAVNDIPAASLANEPPTTDAVSNNENRFLTSLLTGLFNPTYTSNSTSNSTSRPLESQILYDTIIQAINNQT